MQANTVRFAPYAVLLLLVFFAPSVRTQDLTINYDLLTGTSMFFRVGTGGVPTPINDGDVYVGYGDRITVRVINMNPAVYALAAQGTPRTFTIPNAGSDPGKIIRDGIASAQSSAAVKPTQAAVGSKSEPERPDDVRPTVSNVSSKNKSDISSLKEFSETSRVGDTSLADARNAFLSSSEAFINQVAGTFAPMSALLVSLSDLAAVRGTSCGEIQASANARVAAVMGLKMSPAPSERAIIDSAHVRFDTLMAYYHRATDAYMRLDARYRAAEAALDDLTRKGAITPKTSGDSIVAAKTVSETYDWRPAMERRWKGMETLADSVRTNWMPFALEVAEELAAARRLRCERSYDLTAGDDVMDVTIAVRETQGAAGAEPKTLELQKHTIPVVGGLKFNGGPGFGMAWFPNNQRRYFVDSNIIHATAPTGSSLYTMAFAHGYYRARGWFAIGATVGAGVSTGDPHYMVLFVGPSGIFGKAQRIVGTIGLAYGQVASLADSRSLGETFTNTNGELLTETRWAWGITLGVSYNIFSGGE